MKKAPKSHLCSFSSQKHTVSDYVVPNVLLSNVLHTEHVALKKQYGISQLE